MVTFTLCLVLAVLGGAYAATLHKLPLSESEMCDTDAKSGKMCIPDACNSTTCDVIPDAVCVADKCGCRARFFHFTKQDKIIVEVTRTCKAGLHVKVAVAFIKRVMDNDEDAVDAVAKDPKVLLDIFKGLNILSGDVLRVLVAFLQKLNQTEPTRANIQRLQMARDRLYALEQQKNFEKETDVSKILGGKGSLIAGRSTDDLDDEAIQERHHKIFLWIMRVRNPNMTAPTNDTEADVNDEEGMQLADINDEEDMGEKSILGIGAKVVGRVVGKAVGGKAGGTIGKVTNILSNFLDEDHDPAHVLLMDEQTGFAIPLSDVDLEQLANDEDVEEKSFLGIGSKLAGAAVGKLVGGKTGAAISKGTDLLSNFLDHESEMMLTLRDGSHAGAMGLDLFNDIMGTVQNDDSDSTTSMDESAQTLNDLYQMDLEIASSFQDFTDSVNRESEDAEE